MTTSAFPRELKHVRYKCHSGCKCSHCYGLAEYLDDIGVVHNLAPTARLNVQTLGPAHDLEHPCDGSMTCGCQRCVGERQTRVANGVRVSSHDGMPIRIAA